MIKVSAAVIRYEDKVLLMRRSPDQKFAGFWEFPGGKVEQGERTSEALRRELEEELFIKAKVGKLITSVPFGEYEIFAYDVKYYDGIIRLSVHDNMEWVTLDEALNYRLFPADKQIIRHITKTKEKKEVKNNNNSLAEHLTRHISRPEFDEQKQVWTVCVNRNQTQPKILTFASQNEAMDFYVSEASKVLNPFFFAGKPQNIRK